ncbi:MAG: hypothetical protein HQP61_04460 [Peptococcaceae bacterium]|nr:hypothetical protein [Peptococcaceae bacterium]NQS75686.1 hypothetical protein [Candidatus Syntrophopropionicum ammoniitolerans]
MKKRVIIVLLTAALTLSFAAVANSTTGAKMIEATYRGIILMTNGDMVTQEPDMGEPFIVTEEGRTYVPIRMAAEALGYNVEWVDWLNAVQITGSGSSSELEALKAENARLKAQLKDYQDREKEMDFRDLEDDLLFYYSKLRTVDIDDIVLDGKKDNVGVQIKVDLYDFASRWKRLADRDIQYWLEDLVEDIQYELSRGANVTGKITDIDSNDVLVKFSKDGSGELKITFYDDSYRGSNINVDDVIYDIKGNGYDVNRIDFTVSDITYDKNDEEISIILRADYNASSYWRDSDYRYIREDVMDICEDIADIFTDKGFDVGIVAIDLRNSNNSRLESYEYNVARGRLS